MWKMSTNHAMLIVNFFAELSLFLFFTWVSLEYIHSCKLLLFLILWFSYTTGWRKYHGEKSIICCISWLHDSGHCINVFTVQKRGERRWWSIMFLSWSYVEVYCCPAEGSKGASYYPSYGIYRPRTCVCLVSRPLYIHNCSLSYYASL